MADVFISYKSEDRERVQPLVDALTAEGVSVWWDTGIEGGTPWRRSIEAALEAARCVVVVWSRASVGPSGEFVQDEASWAKVRGVYLPILIDDVAPPLGFGQVHTLRMKGWNGQRAAAPFAALLAAVGAMVSGEGRSAPAAAPVSSAKARSSGRTRQSLIAVLPFRFPTGDPEQGCFAEGLAEDLITGLAQSRLLRVMPGQSSLAYPAPGMTTERICADLGADYLVQGLVRSIGGVLRISAHLTHGLGDRTVWSARFDLASTDMLAGQDQVTMAIVGALEPALLAYEEQQAFLTPEAELGAWDLFLRGRWHFWRGRPNDSAKARAYLDRALAARPDDPPTLSLLAHCCLSDVWAGFSPDPRAAIAEAYHFAMKAVGLDGSDAYAHYALGVVLSMMGRAGQAEAEQRRALELSPYLAVAAGEMARLHAFAGRADEAIAEADRAIAASPNDPHAWLWFRAKAIACFVTGRPAEAVAYATDACARRPDYFFLHYLLAACASAAGEPEQASAALAEGRRRMPVYSQTALELGHPFTDRRHLELYLAALRAAGWSQPSPKAGAAADPAPS